MLSQQPEISIMDARGDTSTHSRHQVSSGEGSSKVLSHQTHLVLADLVLADPGRLKLLQRAHSCSKRSKNIFHSYTLGQVSVAVMLDLGGWK